MPLFLSCATLSPVSNEREKPPERSANIEEVFPVWEPLGSAAPGLHFFAGRTGEPRLEFWALLVSLENPRLKIVTNPGDLSVRVTSFTKDYLCAAGINTAPFSPVSAREGEKRTNIGIAVSGGALKSPPAAEYDALIFYKTGGAAIVRQAEITDISAIENAAAGFNIVLEEGRIAARLLESPPDDNLKAQKVRQDLPRHPRSASGLSADGKTLYLLVVDGRRPSSKGATEAELALLLKKLGAYNGLNFDGGGSSVLALRFPGGKVQPVNTPIHNMIPGFQRAVAGCLGIAFIE